MPPCFSSRFGPDAVKGASREARVRLDLIVCGIFKISQDGDGSKQIVAGEFSFSSR